MNILYNKKNQIMRRLDCWGWSRPRKNFKPLVKVLDDVG